MSRKIIGDMVTITLIREYDGQWYAEVYKAGRRTADLTPEFPSRDEAKASALAIAGMNWPGVETFFTADID